MILIYRKLQTRNGYENDLPVEKFVFLEITFLNKFKQFQTVTVRQDNDTYIYIIPYLILKILYTRRTNDMTKCNTYIATWYLQEIKQTIFDILRSMLSLKSH